MIGQQGRPAMPELQQPTEEVNVSATESHNEANSQLSEVTWSGEVEGNYTPKLHILFLHLLSPQTLYLTCYQVATWTK